MKKPVNNKSLNICPKQQLLFIEGGQYIHQNTTLQYVCRGEMSKQQEPMQMHIKTF